MAVPNFKELEALHQKRASTLERNAETLREVEQEINKVMLALGLGPYTPPGGSKKPLMQKAKREQHDKKRAECLKRGWTKADGTADLEKYRVEMKAKKLKITPAEVVKQEANARLKKQSERFTKR